MLIKQNLLFCFYKLTEMMIQKVIRFIKRTEYSLGVTQQKSMCLLLKVIKEQSWKFSIICVSGGAHGYLFMIKDLKLQLTIFPH